MKKILPIVFLILVFPMVFGKSGSMKLLAVSQTGTEEKGSGADLFLEIKQGTGRVFIDTFPLTKLDTQISTRFANEIACDFIDEDCSRYDFFYTITADSAIVGGPSAGAAITILTISVLENLDLDSKATISGTINSGGIIGPVSGISPKIQAAFNMGLNKVIIPKWTKINDTNLTEISEKYGIEIIKVSSLIEAIFELTGKQFNQDEDLIISSSYLNTMKLISHQLCEKTGKIATNLNNSIEENAYELYEKGNKSLILNKFYSAASYCFGANVKFKYLSLLNKNLSKNKIKKLVLNTKKKISEFEKKIKHMPLNTIIDLQTFMIVSERLTDSKNYLDTAEKTYFNNTNLSLYNLAFGIERLESANSWAMFFNTPGKKFKINKNSLAKSCLNKISEVEERIQYVQLYIPGTFQNSRDELKLAYKDYNKGDYELCLFKASKAKAEIDLVLNNLGVENSQIESMIDERLKIVEQIIAQQDLKGIFPIVGYSYFEYAKSLKDSDKFSSLLYLEYALELSKLDIYFQQEKFYFPIIRFEYIMLFLSGSLLGFVVCFVWLKKK